MASIDEIIAGGARTNADFDLGKIAKSYWEGLDQYAKNDLRDAFKPTAANPNGVPMKDGQIDIPAIAKTMFQKGDIAGGVGLLGAANSAGDRAMLAGIGSGQSQAQPVSPPSISSSRLAKVAPELNKGGSSPQGDQPGSIVGLVSAAGIPDELAGPIIQQLSARTKMDTNTTLPPEVSQRVQQVLQAEVQRMRGGQEPGSTAPMVPTPVQTQSIQPQVPPQQVAQAPPQAAQPSPQQLAAQNDPELKKLKFLAASQDKAVAATGQILLKAYEDQMALTPEEKLARASGMNIPQYQEKQGELAAQQAGATERAKNDVAEQKTYQDNGRVAQQRLGILNAMSNIINTDKNLNLGFGSETTLKIKMALQQAARYLPGDWSDVSDLSGAQLLQKFGAALASESTKALATRPTQFEFKTFLANNPGLGLDEKGNVRMIGIMSQVAKREVDLGEKARQYQDNWGKWDDVVKAYDKKFPIKDPTTGNILSSHTIIAPGISIRDPNTGKVLSKDTLEPGKTMMNGYVFKGGNPKDKSSWELRM